MPCARHDSGREADPAPEGAYKIEGDMCCDEFERHVHDLVGTERAHEDQGTGNPEPLT